MKLKFFFFLLFTLSSVPNFANISLPEIFSDNMVLQRNSEVKIWGWAKPGEKIRLSTSWSNKEISTKADRNGNWQLILSTPDVRGSQEITISGYNEVKLKNVLLGEVWLVSGQSNMEWSAGAGITNAEEAIAGAENDQIRFFSVAHRTAGNPQQDLDGSWVQSTPETMKNFSAVAYFFGKKLQEELGVPVGLINSSWGGTPAEVWIPAEAIASNDSLAKAAKMLPDERWGPNEPGLLYNAMIAPLVRFKIQGVLWYQGESNTSNSDYYEQIFSTLIRSWREQWGTEFPFYYAQIAPYEYGDNFSGVEIRDAQRKVRKLPKTEMIMTSDIGNIKDIHPRNKLDVGLRFANLALADHYGKEVDNAYAPQFQKAEKEGNKVTIYFEHAEKLNFDKANKKSQFELAGENGQFHPANVKIEGNTIILKTNKVKEPKQVRFSWGNTSTSNVFNEAGLPVSSFKEEL
ncbi:sialate O-acetylesterase [Salegentibacter sp. F188]|uniref:Sialate O-acetylesterase n=1 Tax=Autumnicola patrickiae TaxID=3075591 RepID=A0ABU3E164_9FLAO|nr:sialate O-acetylesterase [Salegentibacter sp. F188]MDT0688992.1 sialate O-acetylesterase [Salegentibacter sp. F188]